MIGTIPESKVMMHPKPGCEIIVTYQVWPFRVSRCAVVGSFLDMSDMMCCWDVNEGWRFVLYKRSCIHYLEVGEALLPYVGQRTTSNSSSRRPCFNFCTSKVDLIWPMWLLFVSKQHVGFVPLRAKHFLTFHVEHVNAKFGSSMHLCHSVVEHLEISKALVWTLGKL
jgi:hypothetical protein